MTASEFCGYIKAPFNLNANSLKELQELLVEYPYCSTIKILVAKNHYLLDTKEKSTFFKKAVLYAPDRKKFFSIINDISDESLIQNQIPVYSIEMLNDKAEKVGFETSQNIKEPKDDLIDKFIREQPRVNFVPEEYVPDEEDMLTESEAEQEFVSEILAEIYYKQGNPTKSIRIYEKLILKIPEKSSFFAAQIEKIKKEII